MANQTVANYGAARATGDLVNAPQGIETEFMVNNRGDLCIAQALPPAAEFTRMNRSYELAIATASAFTYVAAWPTTRGELVLYNGEAAGGLSYVIENAWMYNITSMGASQPMTLIGQLVAAAAVVPTDDTAQLISSRSGRATYGGKAKKAVANTAAGQLANLWRVLASSVIPAPTTNLGAALFADIGGRVIVPPGGVYALAGIAGTAVGTAIIGVSWSEVQLAFGN